MNAPSLRAIPAVEKVLQNLGPLSLPRPVVLSVVRRELAALRSESAIPEFDSLLERIRGALDRRRLARIQPVSNGSGILIHTNLGRAPLGEAVADTLQTIAANYNNLEYDLAGGERGGRARYLEEILALLCEAEAATAVNNCAAALVLILRHFTASRREVIISRGELVQIGGGFRIPDILESSGAKLREIGATNKTSLADYARAVGPDTALILKVHQSNFFMGGFVESPSTEEIAGLAREKQLPFVEDLGSGAVVATERINAIEHEPTPAEVLARGVDLVCFSGDKLLGGPQAGIIAGRSPLVAALKGEPFFRALRCDKLILAALQTTVDIYLENAGPQPAESQIPVLAMLRVSNDQLRARAERLISLISDLPLKARVGQGEGQIGGGTLPRSVIPSVTLDIVPSEIDLDTFAARLRTSRPPVIGYISQGWFRLDLRTVFSRQDETLVQVLRRLFESNSKNPSV
jgi:L-seryl-tRNA(Ser) seleniumtransferase